MTGSHASAGRRLIIAAAALLASSVAANAQSTAPIPLRPKAPPAERPTPAPQKDSGGIRIETLKAPDANAVGVLDETQGGFGVDMWSGSSRALVQKLVPALPATAPSRTMRDMMRRLLLSTAAVPEGPVPPGDSLLAQRVERLWAMGDVAGMLALLDAAPRTAETAALIHRRIDGLLLKGDLAGACTETAPAKAAGDADLALAKLEAVCHAVLGRTAEADLALAWLRERNHVDPPFFEGMDALLGRGDFKLASLPHPRPLHIALLNAAKKPLPSDAATGNEPAVLRAVALSELAPVETRMVAAEKAEYIGALDTDALRKLYDATTFSDAEADRPLADAAEERGTRSRALLFRAAHGQRAPLARVEIIGRAFALANQHGHFAAAARLYAPLIAEIKPVPEVAFFAGQAVRALLAAGQSGAVAPWLKLVGPRDAAGPAWPLMHLVEPGEDEAVAPTLIAKWLEQRKPLPPERATRQAAMLFGLLDALGDKVGTESWLRLMDGPTTVTATIPQPALWHAQRIAAEDLRFAETVLVGLVSIGAGGLGEADPTSLYRIVAALRLVGLDAEARALAVEAALAHGV